MYCFAHTFSFCESIKILIEHILLWSMTKSAHKSTQQLLLSLAEWNPLSVRYKALNILDLALPLIIRLIICYVLHCPSFSNQRLTLLSKLRGTDENVLSKNTLVILKVLLFGEHSFNNVKITSFNCHNWMHHLS